MVQTTGNILTVDGVVLNTLAKNIESLAGRLSTPARRGSNIKVSGRHGSIYRRKKSWDEGVITLPMWVAGCDDDGMVPYGHTAAGLFYRNLDQLTGLFTSDKLLEIRHTLPDGSERVIWGEVSDAIDFSTSQGIAKFSVSIICPDPFWQDTFRRTVNHSGSGGFSFTGFAGATAPTTDGVCTFYGPATNPGVSYEVGGVTYELRYNKVLLANQSIVIDSENWKLTANGGHVADHAALFHKGDARWLVIPAATPNPVYFFASQTGSPNSLWSQKISGQRRFMIG